MADSKISDLPAASPATPVAADLLALAQEASPGVYNTVKIPFSALSTGVAAELVDDFVNVAGDTMTGNLRMENSDPFTTSGWTITVTDQEVMGVLGDTYDQILTLNPGTASAGNTGQTITGRFRYSMDVQEQNTAAVLGSGATGVATGLVRCSNGSPVTLTIRANDATFEDFDVGNFFSVMQEGAGQVTLIGEDASVVLRIPAGYIAATRAQYSVISATLYFIDEIQYWVISGDLAVTP